MHDQSQDFLKTTAEFKRSMKNLVPQLKFYLISQQNRWVSLGGKKAQIWPK